MSTSPGGRPFVVSWTDRDLRDIRARITNFTWPPPIPDAGWDYGCDLEFLEPFLQYLTTEYDIAAAVQDLNRYPQIILPIEEDVTLHAVHVRSGQPDATPLLMLHGWPGSPFQFWPALDLLTDPERDGPVLDLVIPSLPGYGFSGPSARPVGPKTTARFMHTLMRDHLGYERYLVQGTDWGVVIAPWLAYQQPDAVRAIHIDNLAVLSPANGPDSAEDRTWRQRHQARDAALGGYHRLQTTKPQSLAYAMTDNPIAQAAWILERFHDWTDLRDTTLEQVWGLDRLATSVLLYILTDTFTTSTWMYLGAALEHAGELPKPLTTPTGYCAWPEPFTAQPEPSTLAKHYNLTHWRQPDRGGHFAPSEQPAAFVADLLAWAQASR
jgi:pimeloyl-ACP methyl ester carboxylesterase